MRIGGRGRVGDGGVMVGVFVVTVIFGRGVIVVIRVIVTVGDRLDRVRRVVGVMAVIVVRRRGVAVVVGVRSRSVVVVAMGLGRMVIVGMSRRGVMVVGVGRRSMVIVRVGRGGVMVVVDRHCAVIVMAMRVVAVTGVVPVIVVRLVLVAHCDPHPPPLSRSLTGETGIT